ncbi:uncharacterized protein EKO05_0003729 [Ascochyta rabiei]|uniref:Uncharacterized protein n=1 Tax=Didymella rabiei TaxID=5454 RepID=A0A162WJ49_DIDRA|nr:uncharacterized protein EKO05_0003729 [Ascochyta rabiei]KZM19061.1 hypothetical protein ST47_g9807 [Ascochyta rabiei]UPX13207.1 hypothetical protein EKO05_0003729 [Ascochyta rabiei]
MTRSILPWLRAAAVAALAQQVLSQTCYYPNGNAAPSTEKACSSAAGSACCPENWQCLDNGLCYYPPSGLHGRYSCTDKDWNSPGCASNLCTYNMTVGGGESITQCSNHDDQWCCNADATNVNCCKEEPEPRPFFNLQDGTAYATIGSNQASSNPTISTVTGLAISGASGSSPSKTSEASSPSQTSEDSSPSQTSGASSSAASSKAPSPAASTARPTAASVSPVTSVATSVRSASGGFGPETIYITNVITPAATSDPSSGGATSSGSSGTNTGLIVGCAVGIPLALVLVGILIWILRKRRLANAHPYKATPDGGESPNIAPAALAGATKQEVYGHSRPGTSEIDSNPVGPGRPSSTIPGKAELDSGAGFHPGTGVPFAPNTAFIGGGNGDRSTWGSSPPGYSPGQGQGLFAHNHEGAVELDSSMIMPVINEKSDYQPEYQAFRPPANAVELNAATTPPEDVEKQLPK